MTPTPEALRASPSKGAPLVDRQSRIHGVRWNALVQCAPLFVECNRFARGGWGYAGGAISGATEKIGFGGGVRSTLRRPTHRHCLTTTNEVSDGSFGDGP